MPSAQDNQFEVELNILLKATLFQLAAKFLKKTHHFKSGSSFCCVPGLARLLYGDVR
jgi:hypothetical protein